MKLDAKSILVPTAVLWAMFLKLKARGMAVLYG